MKKVNFFTIIAMIVLMNTNLFADDEPIKGKEESIIKDSTITYMIKINHKTNTFFTSMLTEKTKVHRIYPDSTTKDYSREVIYYITSKIPSGPEDGFQTLVVTVDSMTYKFQDGDAVFEFNTQDMNDKAAKFKDLNCKTASIGRSFDLVYSPYGDVAKIGGSEIDETLEYVKEKGEGFLNPVDNFIWVNGLSKEHLEYLSDLQKVVFPSQRIAKDSIWYSPVIIELNGYSFHDTLAMKMVNYNAGVFSIHGESQALSPFYKESFTYNITDLVKVQSTSGTGKYDIEIKTGKIIFNQADYNIVAKIKVGEQVVIEQIESKIKLEFVKIYKL